MVATGTLQEHSHPFFKFGCRTEGGVLFPDYSTLMLAEQYGYQLKVFLKYVLMLESVGRSEDDPESVFVKVQKLSRVGMHCVAVWFIFACLASYPGFISTMFAACNTMRSTNGKCQGEKAPRYEGLCVLSWKLGSSAWLLNTSCNSFDGSLI